MWEHILIVKFRVSRSQLYNNENDQSLSDSNSDHILQENNVSNEYIPPIGFDFEIVEIEDTPLVEEEENKKEKDDNGNGDKEDEKIEYFPLFSTSSNAEDHEDNKNKGLVRLKIDNLNNDDRDDGNNSDWDEYVKNQSRPDSYYFSKIDDTELKKILEVAVTGTQIYEWKEQFKKITDYRLLDLKKFNLSLKIQKINKDDNKNGTVNKPKKKKRSGRMKRIDKIDNKLKLEEWKKELELAQLRNQKLVESWENTHKNNTNKRKNIKFEKSKSNLSIKTNGKENSKSEKSKSSFNKNNKKKLLKVDKTN